MYTINENHMIGMVPKILQQTDFFCHLGPFFALQKSKFQKNGKNTWWYHHFWFYTSVPKIMIIGYTVPEIWHVTDVIVLFYFGLFFAFLPSPPSSVPLLTAQKNLKCQKKFKKRLELSSFYTSVPKDMIISYTRASAYEKQGCATIARLITKFRNYRRVKSRTPPSKYACGGVRWLFLLEHHSFLPFTMKSTNYN